VVAYCIFSEKIHFVCVLLLRERERERQRDREGERERERSLLATLDIHNCMTNKINIACGRLPEKANAQQAGHLVKIKIRKKYNTHTKHL